MLGHGQATQRFGTDLRRQDVLVSRRRLLALRGSGGMGGEGRHRRLSHVEHCLRVGGAARCRTLLGLPQGAITMSVDAANLKGASPMATSRCSTGTLIEDSNVGVVLNYFNCYDNAFDGCLFRNNAVSIYTVSASSTSAIHVSRIAACVTSSRRILPLLICPPCCFCRLAAVSRCQRQRADTTAVRPFGMAPFQTGGLPHRFVDRTVAIDIGSVLQLLTAASPIP